MHVVSVMSATKKRASSLDHPSTSAAATRKKTKTHDDDKTRESQEKSLATSSMSSKKSDVKSISHTHIRTAKWAKASDWYTWFIQSNAAWRDDPVVRAYLDRMNRSILSKAVKYHHYEYMWKLAQQHVAKRFPEQGWMECARKMPLDQWKWKQIERPSAAEHADSGSALVVSIDTAARKQRLDAVLGVSVESENADRRVCPNRKCKSRNIMKSIGQFRRTDEGMGAKFTCRDCGQKF